MEIQPPSKRALQALGVIVAVLGWFLAPVVALANMNPAHGRIGFLLALGISLGFVAAGGKLIDWGSERPRGPKQKRSSLVYVLQAALLFAVLFGATAVFLGLTLH